MNSVCGHKYTMSRNYYSGKKHDKRPSYLNLADALGAPNPCPANLFLLLQQLIRNEAALPIPRHTYFVSPVWENTSAPLPNQFKTDIQDAIDAIRIEQGDVPDSSDPYLIHIFPGHYSRVGGYTLLSNVNFRGDQIGSVVIDSPVVWTPGSGVNANAINKDELVRFQDIVFTSDFTETVNPLKPLLLNSAVVKTGLRMDKVQVDSLAAAWTFNYRVDANGTADNLSLLEAIWSGPSVGNTASFTVNGGGTVNAYQSFFFLGDTEAQSFNLNGTVASPIHFFFDDNELFVNGNFANVLAVLAGGVIAGPWISTGSSVFEISNCSADQSWAFDISAPGHVDIWSTPHNTWDGVDQITGTGTAHRDYMTAEVTLSGAGVAIIPFTPVMQDTQYVVFATPVSGVAAPVSVTAKTASSVNIVGPADGVVEVLVMRDNPNLAIATQPGSRVF